MGSEQERSRFGEMMEPVGRGARHPLGASTSTLLAAAGLLFGADSQLDLRNTAALEAKDAQIKQLREDHTEDERQLRVSLAECQETNRGLLCQLRGVCLDTPVSGTLPGGE